MGFLILGFQERNCMWFDEGDFLNVFKVCIVGYWRSYIEFNRGVKINGGKEWRFYFIFEVYYRFFVEINWIGFN